MGFREEVVDKMNNLLTAAFGLVAALAWNGAILAIFKGVFGTAESIPAMLAYAIMVTVIAVFATIWISRIAAKAKTSKRSR